MSRGREEPHVQGVRELTIPRLRPCPRSQCAETGRARATAPLTEKTFEMVRPGNMSPCIPGGASQQTEATFAA